MRILFTPSLDTSPTKAAAPAEPLKTSITSDPPQEIILSQPTPVAAPLNVQVPWNEIDERMKKTLEEYKAILTAEWRLQQAKPDPSLAAKDEQIRQNSQEISRLTEEVAGLKKLIVDLQMEKDMEQAIQQRKAVPEPAPEPLKIMPIPLERIVPKVETPIEKPTPPPVASPERSDLLNALSQSSPAPESNERKVAFFTKLWDYLNQPAFENSTRKTDRTQ